MVEALMYLTVSRLDIVHATCYCARYQAKPTEKHLTAVKRIFRYLKDTIHMRLWYLKDTGFELTAFLDSDHVGYLDSRKSTSGGIQFLGGDKLVSWTSKKQDCASMSSAEADPFEELSDIGSPRADDHEHLMIHEMLEDPYVEVALQAPPSLNYIPGPEEPEQAPPSPDYVPGPEHADDEIVAEEQPYAEDASPIAQSPEYDPESDFEAHPKDDDDEGPEEDPVDYLADGGDDGDDKEELLAISSPPASPLSPWSSPPPQIPFLPLPSLLSPPSPVLSPAPPPSPIRSLGYRAAMIQLRDEAASTSSPPLQLPSASHREDRHETEARMSREAWVRATDSSYLIHGEVMSLHTTVLGQMSEIRELQVADRRRQTVISELLRIDHRRSTQNWRDLPKDNP
nr:uncharacterized mitochondrial protein AtMg00810-like [Tanacetum cinerariifolium]